MELNKRNIKNIHFVGIKGVGMTPLAIIAKEAGCRVTGSDIKDEFITDLALKKAQISLYEGFHKDNIKKDTDLIITTGAHGGFNNEEVKAAKDLGIKVITQGEAVGVFMDGKIFGRKFRGISIAGSHGKTTTTGMVATIFRNLNFDPSYLIGTSDIPSLGLPGHFGKGDFFIAEADEYATEPSFDKTPKFLWQNPNIILITNIDFDHTDIYGSIDEVREAFLSFAGKLAKNGILVVNGDDKEVQKLLLNCTGNIITFGFSPKNDYAITKISIESDCAFFRVDCRGVDMGEFMINVSGEHNIINALGAVVVSLESGLALTQIKKVLPGFKGSKRRLEYMGNLNSKVMLFDDYAHHPTEIKATLNALRKRYPEYKIVCIFQPHTYSRTKKLLDQFVCSFNDSDTVVLTNIYASLREKNDQSISSEYFAQKLSENHKNVLFLPMLVDVIEYIAKNNYANKTIIITMGAGDIYKVHEKLSGFSGENYG